MYDPKTVETISGQVVSVERIAGKGGGRGQGVHLTVKTDKGKIAVHLGPSWYLEKQGITFSAHDQVEVHGSRVTYDGKPAVIAASITKGEQTLTLRDAQGLPQWRGQGRRGR
ncbi:MAG TPA: DNA-binding protein [Candidatus Kryptonia bacterium]|nr:DNA-binding protein [Candidatus Kryptonia bacterium]